MSWIIDHEAVLRLSVFVSVLVGMGLAEALAPRRARVMARSRRWFANIAIVVTGTIALRLLMPLIAVGAAAIAATRGWGILNVAVLPDWLSFMLAFILLDLAVYGQHVASHKFAPLWALHKVHHADRDFDVTTALRFHPVEILASMAYKIVVVIMLGAPVAAVIVFEVVLNASAMFNHANLRLPLGLDKALRKVIVTPDMHRVHHSVVRIETDSNYGFCLPWWDYLFATYRAQPEAGHDAMTIGLPDYQDEKPASFLWSLWLPFAGLFRRDRQGEETPGR